MPKPAAVLTLDDARAIIAAAFAKASEMKLKPLAVAVLDAGGQLKALERQDDTSTMRAAVAIGKANGALALGLGSRALFARAQQQPYFISAANTLAGGSLVPVPGGVLIRHDGAVIGAVGISGDTSDNDEACAIAGITAAGLAADPG
ncbi:MAG: heme-binding protein [Thalassobaculales bacterium]